VGICGVTHNPFTPSVLADPSDARPQAIALRREFSDMRERLRGWQVDVVLALGSDHLNQWSTDNMPAFLVGKAPEASGPFGWEREIGVPSYRCPGARDVAVALIQRGYDNGVDFSYADDYRLDHSLVVPLHALVPEQQTPVVPIFSNAMIPPLPTPKRYFDVGRGLRVAIGQLDEGLRVAAICSGHLSLEIGGSRGAGWTDPSFDEHALDLLKRGASDELLREMTLDSLAERGNATWGFLNFVLLMGLADSRPASHVSAVRGFVEQAPFLAWELEAARG
jgi:protocatechuate 4,5-dioxygenase beta chain